MINVLVVDDSDLVRKAIRKHLNDDPDILLTEAASFKEAIRLAPKLRPHVIVTDIHMRDEREVTSSQIKTSFEGTHLLAMSFWTDDEAKKTAEDLGAIMFLDKMNLANDLIPAIRQYAGA